MGLSHPLRESGSNVAASPATKQMELHETQCGTQRVWTPLLARKEFASLDLLPVTCVETHDSGVAAFVVLVTFRVTDGDRKAMTCPHLHVMDNTLLI